MATTNSPALPAAQPLVLGAQVDYNPGAIVSRAIVQKKTGSLTLFAFDAGQALSEHTAPFDAWVQVLDGEAELVIGGTAITVPAGQAALMPANISHAVNARVRFKMLLSMIRGE